MSVPLAARVSAGLIFSSLFALGCSDASSPDGRTHPIPELLVRPVAPSGALHFNGPDQYIPPELSATLSALQSASTEVRIGALNAPEGEAFGKIEDVVLDPYGRIIVLDSQARELRVFDEHGHTLQILGGHGGGPAEFWHPRALAVAPDGRLFVFDGMARINILETGPDSIRFSDSFRVDGDVFDGCVMGDRLYVHGANVGDGPVIHAYTLAGEPLHSFGEVYRTRNRIVWHQLSKSRIACVEAADVLLLAPEALPEVRAYNPSGKLEWWVSIDGLLPVELIETPTGGSTLRIPESGHHLSTALVPSSDDNAVILQVTRVISQDQGPDKGINHPHTFLISLDQRAGVHAGNDWPRIFDWSSDRLIIARESPYPEVSALRLDR